MVQGRKTDPAVLAQAVEKAQRTGDWSAAGREFGVGRNVMAREKKKRRAERKPSVQTPSPRKPKSDPGSDPGQHFERLVGEAQDLDELQDVIDQLKAMLDGAKPGDSGLASLFNARINAIGKRAKMRPPPPPGEAELAEAARMADNKTRKKMLQYTLEHETAAARDKVCTHCGSELTDEKVKELYGV